MTGSDTLHRDFRNRLTITPDLQTKFVGSHRRNQEPRGVSIPYYGAPRSRWSFCTPTPCTKTFLRPLSTCTEANAFSGGRRHGVLGKPRGPAGPRAGERGPEAGSRSALAFTNRDGYTAVTTQVSRCRRDANFGCSRLAVHGALPIR